MNSFFPSLPERNSPERQREREREIDVIDRTKGALVTHWIPDGSRTVHYTPTIQVHNPLWIESNIHVPV
jgi:hypothetical protein